MSRPSKVLKEREPEVVDQYLGGRSLQELGERFGCSDRTIARILRVHGVPRRPCKKPRVVDHDEVVRLFESGVGTTEIASRLGCTSPSVVRILGRHGVSAKKPKIPAGVGLVAKYKGGATLMGLARKYGCSARTVAETLRRRGATIRCQGAVGYQQDPKFVRQVVTMRAAGRSYEGMAKVLGTSPGAVRHTTMTQGLPQPPQAEGPNHGSWKGGRSVTGDGYALVAMPPNHPFAPLMRRSNGYCLEHRLVMAKHIDRPLKRSETVHHKKGKTDNRIENLQLRQGNHGKNRCFQCNDCGSRDVIPVDL